MVNMTSFQNQTDPWAGMFERSEKEFISTDLSGYGTGRFNLLAPERAIDLYSWSGPTMIFAMDKKLDRQKHYFRYVKRTTFPTIPRPPSGAMIPLRIRNGVLYTTMPDQLD